MSDQAPKDHEVRIHIDRKPYESPETTTHAALYALGKVPAGYELFLEVQGNQEDQPIPNDSQSIHLKQDQHFYSAQVSLNPGIECGRA
jgi:hypothetical protein